MSDFFPTNYEVPVKESGYMKFEQGENRFRVLVPPIIGWEYWVDKDGEVRQKGERPQKGDKPVRVKDGQPVPAEVGDGSRHFWAMVVWNYQLKRVQILQITQNGIQRTIRGLEKDKDWGAPVGYDLVVVRTGEDLDTEYEVMPKPKKELDLVVSEAFKNTHINLEALFEGKDPFATNGAEDLAEEVSKKT